MSPTELKNYILEKLQVPVNEVVKVIDSLFAIIDFITTAVSTIIPDWTGLLNFKLDGTAAGKYCTFADTNGKKRIFETKIDNNLNNLPPSNPLVTENTYWKEVSSSAGSAISGWASGLYGPGLQIVYHDHSADGKGLYVLNEPVRPFASANIETEITALKWNRLGGTGTGGGPAIAGKYANIAALLADQGAQVEDSLYFVTDASADATVDAGWALYQKLNPTTGAITDYKKLSEQESLDVIFSQPDASESVKGIAELATQGEVNAETDDSRIVTPKKLSEKPVAQEAYSATLTFTKNYRDAFVDQVANIVIDADFTGAIHQAEKLLYVNGDNVHSLIFTSKYEKISGSLDFDNTKLNHIHCVFNDRFDKVYYHIVHTSRIVADLSPPTIISANVASNNAYVDITLSEGSFNTNAGAGALEVSDFNLTFFQNGGTATAVTISAVKRNDAATSGAASALIGGEATIRVFISITGSVNGLEYVTIKPSSGAAIYDAAGNAMLSTQTTANLALNAADNVAPVINSAQMAANNSYVDVVFSEGVFTNTSLGPCVQADFTFTFNQNGGDVTAASVTSITNTSGGALVGGETTIRFNLSVTGVSNGLENCTITPVSGAAVYDASGNVMTAGQTTGLITFTNVGYSSAALTVFGRMPDSMSSALKNAMATFIDSQVAAGNWAKLDEFQFYGLNTQANSNTGWKAVNATPVNGALWVAGSHYFFDGSNDYLDTGWRPVDGVQFTQNDAVTGCFVKEWLSANGTGKILMGCFKLRGVYMAGGASGALNRAINNATFNAYGGEGTFANNTLYHLARIASTDSLLYKNGAQVDTDAATSGARPAVNLYIGARNNDGTADLHSNCRVTAWFAGKGIAFDHASFDTALHALITAVGA